MTKPIRVLHVVTYMGRGGLETMLMNYYRNIDRTKVQFDFLAHRSDTFDYDDEILNFGGKIYKLPRLNPFDRNYLKQLDNFFREHKEYKIVHSHLDCMSTFPLKYAMKNGVNVRIAHSHSTNQVHDLKYPIKVYSKHLIRNYANNLFACSLEAGRWMFNTNNFIVLNNAIDAKKYIFNKDISRQVRESLNIKNGFVIGHIGNFNFPKNHSFLVDIFLKIYQKNQNTYLLLVGDGNLKKSIENKVNSLGLSQRVIFTGFRSDIPNLLQAMDCFVFPSHYEGLGIAMIEAQASGLKCLMSDKVPSKCIITNNVKTLSLNDSPDYWANQILELENGYNRCDTYQNIINAKFDIKENVKWLEEFYLEKYEEANTSFKIK